MEAAHATSNVDTGHGVTPLQATDKKFQEAAHQAFKAYAHAKPRWWQVQRNDTLTCQDVGGFAESACGLWHDREYNSSNSTRESRAYYLVEILVAVAVFLATYVACSKFGAGGLMAIVTSLVCTSAVAFARSRYQYAQFVWEFHERDRKARQKYDLETLTEHYLLDREMRWLSDWADHAQTQLARVNELMGYLRHNDVECMDLEQQRVGIQLAEQKRRLDSRLHSLRARLRDHVKMLRGLVHPNTAAEEHRRVLHEAARLRDAFEGGRANVVDAIGITIGRLRHQPNSFEMTEHGLHELTRLITKSADYLPEAE